MKHRLVLGLVLAFLVGCGRGQEPVTKVTKTELKPKVKIALSHRSKSRRIHDSGVPVVATPRLAGVAAPPPMPLEPFKTGKLNGVVIVLDPGHGGSDPGVVWYQVIGGQRYTYHEASYTYRMCAELSDMLRKQGATVFLTEYSQVFERSPVTNPRDPEPQPSDAAFVEDGQPSRAGKMFRQKRAHMSEIAQAQFPNSLVVFLSIHIDGMPKGWGTGAHVCCDAHEPVPDLARILSRKLVSNGYGRAEFTSLPGGKKTKELVRPLDHRCLDVLHYQKIPERVLIEMGMPRTPADSWRIRSPKHRRRLLEQVIESLKDLKKKSPQVCLPPPYAGR